MNKYARPVPTNDETRMMDIFDPGVYNLSPTWGQTDADLLDSIFENNKAAWVATGQWFVAAPNGVQNGAMHTGADFSDPRSHVNSDNTDGNGNPV